ncbi:MAG: hypothetical protein IJW36_00030 [Clostridia bacterium]|nr:hypothetical protein [Clostridia bacterium]
MVNEKLRDLVKELIERIKYAKIEAGKMSVPKEQEGNTFIHDGDKHFVHPSIVPFDVHCEIVELFKFVRKYPNISDHELKFILSSNEFYFHNLKQVYQKVPNLLKEFFVKNEEKHVPFLYANAILAEQREKKRGFIFSL